VKLPKINVKGRWIDVDIRAELERFSWQRARWTETKLIAASPFRYDRTPSFFVNLDGMYAGTWGDSGAYDSEWESGGFVKLLAFLRNETEDETAEYLIETYALSHDSENLTLRIPRLTIQRKGRSLDSAILAGFQTDYSYLKGRGISEDVQRQMGVRYDAASQAVVIPWFTPDGKLANIKYRKTRGKAFWYHRGGDGLPIRDLVYGLDWRAKVAVLTEAEIDAMSWRQVGVTGLATGGVSFTSTKRDLILRSAIERLYIATDNDKAGRKLRDEVVRALRGRVELFSVEFERGFKDSNEVLVRAGESALREALSRAERISGLVVRLST
jgi:5S rRNA maturation endonuclease (ribonuclease M5)